MPEVAGQIYFIRITTEIGWVLVMVQCILLVLQDGKLVIQEFSHPVVLLTHGPFYADSATLWLQVLCSVRARACVCVCVCVCVHVCVGRKQMILSHHSSIPLLLWNRAHTQPTSPHQSDTINGACSFTVSHYINHQLLCKTGWLEWR